MFLLDTDIFVFLFFAFSSLWWFDDRCIQNHSNKLWILCFSSTLWPNYRKCSAVVIVVWIWFEWVDNNDNNSRTISCNYEVQNSQMTLHSIASVHLISSIQTHARSARCVWTMNTVCSMLILFWWRHRECKGSHFYFLHNSRDFSTEFSFIPGHYRAVKSYGDGRYSINIKNSSCFRYFCCAVCSVHSGWCTTLRITCCLRGKNSFRIWSPAENARKKRKQQPSQNIR